MRLRLFTALAAAAALAACGSADQQSSSADLQAFDVTEAPPPGMASFEPPEEPAASGSPVARAAPQIAYSYTYAFRVPGDRLAAVQERHLELCHQLGPQRCSLGQMRRDASSGDYVQATLTLQVAAPIARQFGQRLVATAAEAGADTVDQGVSGEDLSKQIVDAEARIRTREVLVRRLTQILETRSGNIQQAVEAERAVTQAQEELEAARAWLAEMRGRVAMSTFTISYNSGAPLAGGLSEPVRGAAAEVGGIVGKSLAAMIILLGTLLPWALLALLVWVAVRTARRRFRRGREEPMAGETGTPPAEA